jgi:hypothetical protein
MGGKILTNIVKVMYIKLRDQSKERLMTEVYTWWPEQSLLEVTLEYIHPIFEVFPILPSVQ